MVGPGHLKPSRYLPALGRVSYTNQVLRLAPVAYFPLNEASGTIAYDRANGNNGTHINTTLGAAGIGNRDKSTTFSPAGNSGVNIYTAGLNTVFNGQLGTAIIWGKVSAAGVWSDSTIRYLLYVRVNDQNRIIIRKASAFSGIEFRYIAGNTAEQLNLTLTDTAWFMLAMTWTLAGDAVNYYYNGQLQTPSSTLGTWTGSLSSTTCVIGAEDSTPATSEWDGELACCALFDKVLTASQIRSLLAPSDLAQYRIWPSNPPSYPNQYSWFDFNDTDYLYQNAAKTTPVTGDGQFVRVAEDKFGLSNEELEAAADAERPHYHTNVQNSLAALQWDASDDNFDHAEWPDGDFTYFLVMKNLDSANGSHVQYVAPGSYFAITGDTHVGGEYGVIHLEDGSTSFSRNIVNSMGFNVWEVVRDGNDWTMYCNGLAGTTETADTLFGAIAQGDNANVNYELDGYVAEQIRYSAALDAKTRAAIRYYLADKWNISNMTYSPYLPAD